MIYFIYLFIYFIRPLAAACFSCRYQQTFVEDVTAIWTVWVPVQIFNFGFMPMWMRVPLTTMVSMFFTCYVSLLRGKPEVPAAAAAAAAGEAVATAPHQQQQQQHQHQQKVKSVVAAVAAAKVNDDAHPPPAAASSRSAPKVCMASEKFNGDCVLAIAAHERDGIGAFAVRA